MDYFNGILKLLKKAQQESVKDRFWRAAKLKSKFSEYKYTCLGYARILNAVEIEEAITQLAESSFNKDEFPYQFLEDFGNKSTTIKRLKRIKPHCVIHFLLIVNF